MLVSLVVPTYNESENIVPFTTELAKEALKESIDLEIVVVDDNSPDGTWKLVGELEKDPPRGVQVRLIHRRGERGLASAVITGWRYCRGEIIGVTDADGSHPAENLHRMLEPFLQQRCDVVFGSRYIEQGSFGDWPALRHLISKVAAFLSRPLTKVQDCISGYLFFRRNVIRGIRIRPTGYKIGLDILVRGNYSKVEEVPYHFVNRKRGASKMGSRELLHYLDQLVRLYLYRLTH